MHAYRVKMTAPTIACLLVVLLVSGGPGSAWGQPAGGVELRGHIEEIRDSELIVRGEDGKLHYVDTAAIPSAQLGALNPGDEIAITIKSAGARGPIGRSVQRRVPAPPEP